MSAGLYLWLLLGFAVDLDMRVCANLDGSTGLNAHKFHKMKTYVLFGCDMLNDDGRKFGTAYFYAKDPEGEVPESVIEEIRQSESGDIWNQTWMVNCTDRNEAKSKMFEYMESTGQI